MVPCGQVGARGSSGAFCRRGGVGRAAVRVTIACRWTLVSLAPGDCEKAALGSVSVWHRMNTRQGAAGPRAGRAVCSPGA